MSVTEDELLLKVRKIFIGKRLDCLQIGSALLRNCVGWTGVGKTPKTINHKTG